MAVCLWLLQTARNGSWSSNRLFLATLRQELPLEVDFITVTNIFRILDNRLTLFIAER
jgi:hypothetical protein